MPVFYHISTPSVMKDKLSEIKFKDENRTFESQDNSIKKKKKKFRTKNDLL